MRGSCESGMRKPGHSPRARADKSRIRTGSWASQCTMSQRSRHEVFWDSLSIRLRAASRPQIWRIFSKLVHTTSAEDDFDAVAALQLHQKRNFAPFIPKDSTLHFWGCTRNVKTRHANPLFATLRPMAENELRSRARSDCHIGRIATAPPDRQPAQQSGCIPSGNATKQLHLSQISKTARRQLRAAGPNRSEHARASKHRWLAASQIKRTCAAPRGTCDPLAAHGRPGLVERLPEARLVPCAPGTPRAVYPTRG